MTNVCPTANCDGGANYTISLVGAMKNPSTVITISGNFVVETLTSAGFIVGYGSTSNDDVTPILPEPFSEYAVTRTSYYMSDQADIIVNFTTVNAVPIAGFFRVIIPLDQATPPTTPTCKSYPSNQAITCKIIFKTSTFVVIDVNQNC